ncbi:restriction endonuclease subunit S [Pseudomonas lopnurensis]|uniref:restriction endonuclease subunit S n=1 Tax=Pseudomonas lopnurensis TaxID=1477517 RepID=UPI0018794313|nr:restriction endonuclease subunit S [Pseudomonas lopnurensis]MBE7376389.1 restriction endonuclease subunit S [Pseudomonas lopnurensis]
MSAAIPQGWQECRLENCVEVLDSLRVPVNNVERQSRIEGKSAEQLYPYYGATGQVGVIDDFLFDEELVALGEDGVPFLDPFKQKAYMLCGKTWVNNHAHVLRGLDGVALNKFVFYYLNQFDYQGYVNGGTRLKLTQANMRIIPIPLPPLAEQTRIAAKLDELLAQVDTLKARIDGIPALLKRFRQSVLAAAVSGRLTEEWRVVNTSLSGAFELHRRLKAAHTAEGGHARGNASDPTEEAHDLCHSELPEQWDIAELRDVCAPGRPITYGILKPGPELEEGVPYIRVADFPGNKLNLASIKKTSPEIDLQYKRARLITGDLLLSIRGSVGRLIKIPRVLEGANITQDTARLSISSLVSTDFVYWTLLSDSTQRRMRNATRGVAVRGINIGDVRALQIPLPPAEEQTEIVRRVEQLFAFADQLEARVKAAQAHIDRLTQSILAKAFRGELVPQDPNDEPASVLLERIKAQRAAAPKARRGRRTATLS